VRKKRGIHSWKAIGKGRGVFDKREKYSFYHPQPFANLHASNEKERKNTGFFGKQQFEGREGRGLNQKRKEGGGESTPLYRKKCEVF